MKKLSYKRHLFKAITWRIVGTIDTILISWFITQNIELGIKIGAFELITKFLLYFVHERIWYKLVFDIDRNSRIRHMLKSISWRFIGSIDTAIISWIATGNISFGITIGTIEVASKTILYYFHERIWYKIKYGVIDQEILKSNTN